MYFVEILVVDFFIAVLIAAPDLLTAVKIGSLSQQTGRK